MDKDLVITFIIRSRTILEIYYSKNIENMIEVLFPIKIDEYEYNYIEFEE